METAIRKQITILMNRVTVVNYVQGTDVIPIEFEIMDYPLPTDTEARIYIHKPSKAIIYNMVTTKTDRTVEEKIEMNPSDGRLTVGGTIIQNGFVDTYTVNADVVAAKQYFADKARGVSGTADFWNMFTGEPIVVSVSNGIVTDFSAIKNTDADKFFVRQTQIQNGDGPHLIKIGWSGSKLCFFVDDKNVAELPNGYRP